MRENFWRRIIIAAAFLCVAAFSLHQIIDFDVWFHLRAGSDICRLLQAPRYDSFSYTASGHPYIDSHWLFQVILFNIFRFFGANGLIIFKSVMALSALALLFSIGYNPSLYLVSVLALLLCLFNIRERIFERPEMVTFLLMAYYLYILHRSEKEGPRILYLLPLLQVIWVNCHGLFILGLVLIGSYAACGIFVRPIKARFPYWKIFFACVAACFINPYGIQGIAYSLRLFTEIGTSASYFMKQVAELKSPGSLGPVDLFSYITLIGVGAITFLINYKRADLWRISMFLLFAYLSFLAQRNIALLAVVSMPILVVNTQEALLDGNFRKMQRLSFLRWPLEIGIFAGMGLLIFCVVTNIFYVQQRDLRRFGLGVSRLTYPAQAIRFIEAEKIQGNIFNDANFGGYLVWNFNPPRKVFVDGRWEVYKDGFLTNYLRALNDVKIFEKIAQRYSINYVILSSQNSFVRLLYFEKDWSLVYADALAVVFAKNRPALKFPEGPILAQYQFPEREDYTIRSLTSRSEDALLSVNKANFFNLIGNDTLAEAEYKKALSYSLYLPEIYRTLGKLMMRKGDYAKAEDYFDRLARIK
jgi:hypothetical protein